MVNTSLCNGRLKLWKTCIGYPESHELFKDFNCFLNSWEVFSTKLLKIRRSSIKDKYAINLLSNLDSAKLNGIKLLKFPVFTQNTFKSKIGILGLILCF
ncbi:hypothetical protein QTP88_008082 [Uroleucon formosanum]